MGFICACGITIFIKQSKVDSLSEEKAPLLNFALDTVISTGPSFCTENDFD